MCDYFGVVYVINTRGKEKFTTACGGFFSIVTLVIVTGLTLLYGADFFYKKNGIVTENELTSVDPEYVDIGNYEYPFMARLKFGNEFNLPSARFQINFRYWHYIEEIPGQQKFACLVEGNSQKSCAETPYNNNSLDFKKEDLSNFICPDFESIRKQCVEQTKDPNYKVLIGGNAGDKYYAFLSVQVSNFKYNSAGEKIDIVDESHFINYDGDTWLDFRYPHFNFNSTVPNNALKTVIKKERQAILPSSFRFEQKWFKRVSLQDDLGWLAENLTNPIESVDQDESLSTSSGPYIYGNGKLRLFNQILFMVNSKTLTFTRRYMKLQDLMALIGGTIKIIVSVNFFFARLVAIYLRQRALIEDYFELKREMKENVPAINSIVTSSAEVKVKENIKGATSIGFFEWYISCGRPSAVRQGTLLFYRKANEYIGERMDVCSILELFEKFSRLSEAVLTEDQMHEFSSKKKTMIANLI